MTVLSICQSASDELGLARPGSIVSNTDPDARKLFRQLTKCSKLLAARFDWQKLRKERTFTTTAAAEQAGAIPSDFLRFVPDAFWNRTQGRRVYGTLGPDAWQEIQANLATGPTYQFIQRGDAILFTPTPAAGETVAFEYIKNAIGTSSGGSDVAAFTADDDVPLWSEELMIRGVVYMMRQLERLDYDEEMRDFERHYKDETKIDGGSRTIDMNESWDALGSVRRSDWFVQT
jgi:hypothetical protein